LEASVKNVKVLSEVRMIKKDLAGNSVANPFKYFCRSCPQVHLDLLLAIAAKGMMMGDE
jgi:hypothetical protein